MLDSAKAQSFYYSAHHLARDLFWNAGNFAFFLILGAALDMGFREEIWSVVSELAKLNSPTIQIAASIAGLALGAVSGIIANQAYVALTGFFSWIPFLRALTYDGWYQKDREGLRALYDRVFGHNSELLLRQKHRPMELDIRLTTYMRLHNPSGYVHVFRTYSVVALFRQAIVYSALLLFWNVQAQPQVAPPIQSQAAPPILFVAIILVLLLALREAVEYSVSREYAFLVATLQWVEEHRSMLEKGSDQTANTGLQAGG